MYALQNYLIRWKVLCFVQLKFKLNKMVRFRAILDHFHTLISNPRLAIVYILSCKCRISNEPDCFDLSVWNIIISTYINDRSLYRVKDWKNWPIRGRQAFSLNLLRLSSDKRHAWRKKNLADRGYYHDITVRIEAFRHQILCVFSSISPLF